MRLLFPVGHSLPDECLDFWFGHGLDPLKFIQPILDQHNSSRTLRQVDVTVLIWTAQQGGLQHIIDLFNDAF